MFLDAEKAFTSLRLDDLALGLGCLLEVAFAFVFFERHINPS
jgi:hypothetical protein